MRVRHLLFGCAVCFAGIGTAAATSVDARDLDGSARTASDNSGAPDGGSSGGDALRVNRDGSARGTSGDGSTSGSRGTSSDRSANEGNAPLRAPQQQPHLGWQSLLPGSIQ
jgi:hypothetical protein